ncbi:uncharacterized protein B0H18DRAFT_1211947 [Fomitopsis serialis]|uniref:uncharacterized protein n=1 Tax=Fomitopsis serialis TaxID=139415 RepID=UPI0020088796|nr:uncharacterized protein B0H18DRAFT_1211947 [Neoantrodia serialis]KAH9924189.1 hypothetical protein B0H18DRAFT_1211947 [Neoantrodia serialis]
MSLYSILISNMLPNHTPPFDHDLQNPGSDYPSLPSYSGTVYTSDDLSHVGFSSHIDPFASTAGPLPISGAGPYVNPTSASTWTQGQGYLPYGNDQQTQLAPSASVPAHQWQLPTGSYPAAHQDELQVYGQTFAPGHLMQSPSTNMAYHGVTSMPAVHSTIPAQYPTEIAIGPSHPAQWDTTMMNSSSGGAIGLQQRTYPGAPQQGSYSNSQTSSLHSSRQPAVSGQRRPSPTQPTTPVSRRSPADSHRSGHTPEPRPSSSRTPRSSSQTPCCWGGFCGTSLNTLPIAAISHHLKEAHIDRHTGTGVRASSVNGPAEVPLVVWRCTTTTSASTSRRPPGEHRARLSLLRQDVLQRRLLVSSCPRGLPPCIVVLRTLHQ